MQSIEMVGETFDLNVYLTSQNLCREISKKIASKVGQGISEAEGQQLIREEFLKEGISKFWHPSKFRVGPETVKSFRELPNEAVRLEKGDIFFIDVGPIIEGHEADYGETFMHSDNNQRTSRLKLLAESSFQIWKDAAKQWKAVRLSGVGLFEFADQASKAFGFHLNPLMAGHRLGDFPHALFSKDKLFSLGIVPKENLWVLEIHVLDPVLQRGAFFEDILS
jgi:hypothetical protein